jgi:hypothetical protein
MTANTSHTWYSSCWPALRATCTAESTLHSRRGGGSFPLPGEEIAKASVCAHDWNSRASCTSQAQNSRPSDRIHTHHTSALNLHRTSGAAPCSRYDCARYLNTGRGGSISMAARSDATIWSSPATWIRPVHIVSPPHADVMLLFRERRHHRCNASYDLITSSLCLSFSLSLSLTLSLSLSNTQPNETRQMAVKRGYLVARHQQRLLHWPLLETRGQTSMRPRSY